MSNPAMDSRRAESGAVESTVFDVAIIGAGISGACLFHHLRSQGFRALLVDKSDFAGGTSQASAMMVWGGLLYLCSLDFPTVYRLSSSRDELIRGMQDWVRPRTFRYLVPSPGPGNRLIVQAALYLYWLMGRCRRARPRLLEDFHELSLLNRTEPRNCFAYEEAYLPDSDARFVLQWILRGRGIDNPALNYCAARGGHFERDSRAWRLDVEDLVLGRQMTARAKLVVNAAGVWTDAVNEQFGIDTPYKHILSKGVFIGIPRHPSHQTPLIFAGEGERDCFSLIPWGPIALWGPTETLTADTREGLAVSIGDVRMLLEELNRHLARPVQPDDIVSFRCGIRGLAVRRSTHNVRHSLHLSRKYVVHRDGQAPWISIHGGKLTSCVPIAHAASDAIRRSISPTGMPLACPNNRAAAPELEAFPGLEESVPSAQWCAHESCWTLEDYLRRRTNIAQWVSRGGLGGANENAARLEHLAAVFTHGASRDARAAVHAYQKKIETEFDRVVAGCAEDWDRVSQPIPSATPLEEAI